MRRYYREKRYYCGCYMDLYIFPTYESRKKVTRRKKDRKPTSAAQKKLNERHRKEKLARLLHANFTPEDIALHLTYRDGEQPEDDAAVKRDLWNYIRRIKRLRKKLGLPPLKYVATIEKGKRNGRYHIHFPAMSGDVDRDTLEKLWGKGYANSLRLQFTENGLVGLANYTTKSPLGGKSWYSSKNLIDPDPNVRDGKISANKVQELAMDPSNRPEYEKLEAGYFLAEAETFYNDEFGGHYIIARYYRQDNVYIKPKKKRKGGKRNGD
ncbi:MAG: hypothetical protein J1E06_05830 [Acutalibacter sp.]|nr:hypothetical protein [Acutalibacter sp.]